MKHWTCGIVNALLLCIDGPWMDTLLFTCVWTHTSSTFGWVIINVRMKRILREKILFHWCSILKHSTSSPRMNESSLPEERAGWSWLRPSMFSVSDILLLVVKENFERKNIRRRSCDGISLYADIIQSSTEVAFCEVMRLLRLLRLLLGVRLLFFSISLECFIRKLCGIKSEINR